MEVFAVGDIVLLNFPFSSLRSAKSRPALILAAADYGDVIICQITSRVFGDIRHIRLDESSFSEGRLPVASYIRYDKLFTLDRRLLLRKIGSLEPDFLHTVFQQVRKLFTLQ